MAGRHKAPFQEHLSGLLPFLPPRRGQSWNILRVLFRKGEDGPAQDEEAGLGEQHQTWQEA